MRRLNAGRLWLLGILFVLLTGCRPGQLDRLLPAGFNDAVPVSASPADLSVSPCADPAGLEVPLGKAVFLLRNMTRTPWELSIAAKTFGLPGYEPGQPCRDTFIILHPGDYTWQARLLGEDFYLPDRQNTTEHHFTAAAGEIYVARLSSLSPDPDSQQYVVEVEQYPAE